MWGQIKKLDIDKKYNSMDDVLTFIQVGSVWALFLPFYFYLADYIQKL